MNKSGELPGELRSGQWIRFVDHNGPGYCQPDHFIVQNACVLCFECKLSQTEYATNQLFGLYLPVLQFIYKRPVVCFQVFKNWRFTADTIEHPLMGEPLVVNNWNLRL
jgi:hypothetical protein